MSILPTSPSTGAALINAMRSPSFESTPVSFLEETVRQQHEVMPATFRAMPIQPEGPTQTTTVADRKKLTADPHPSHAKLGAEQ